MTYLCNFLLVSLVILTGGATPEISEAGLRAAVSSVSPADEEMPRLFGDRADFPLPSSDKKMNDVPPAEPREMPKQAAPAERESMRYETAQVRQFIEQERQPVTRNIEEEQAVKRIVQRADMDTEENIKTQNQQEQQDVSRDPPKFLSFSVGDMLPLMAVLAVIVVMAIVLKRYTPARRMLGGGGAVEVVARTAISSKQTLVLVKMGPKLILVGVSPERMSTLSVVDDPEQVALLMGEVASARPDSMTRVFAESIAAERKQYDMEEDERPARRAAAPQGRSPRSRYRIADGQPTRSADEQTLTETGGQVRGLLEKLRKMSEHREVA